MSRFAKLQRIRLEFVGKNARRNQCFLAQLHQNALYFLIKVRKFGIDCSSLLMLRRAFSSNSTVDTASHALEHCCPPARISKLSSWTASFATIRY